MTVLLWLVIVVAALLGLAIGLRAFGTTRWTALIRTHSSLLELGRVDAQKRLPLPTRFDPRELEGLPAPVQRYFREALKDGQPIVAKATVEMAGTMNMSSTSERWKQFTSVQQVVTRAPGFLWDARVDMFSGLPVHVEDSYIAGRGRLVAKVLGLFTVADLQGDGEIARGEFMRYFAESPWYPTSLLPSQGVRWTAVDDTSASATLSDGPISLTLLFQFNATGLIASVHAKSRGASVGKDGAMVMRPWDCAFLDYQLQGDMLIPMTGEAAWILPEGRKVYFVGHVTKLSYEFFQNLRY